MRSCTLAFLFLAACSSSTPSVEHRTLEGEAGQAIEVSLVGVTQPRIATMFRDTTVPQQLSMQFEVSNNSNDTVTVSRIQVDQHGNAPLQLDGAQAGFDESIEPGHDHTFTVNAYAKQVAAPRLGQDNSLIIRVVVTLTNGDSYVYNFAVPLVEVQ